MIEIKAPKATMEEIAKAEEEFKKETARIQEVLLLHEKEEKQLEITILCYLAVLATIVVTSITLYFSGNTAYFKASLIITALSCCIIPYLAYKYNKTDGEKNSFIAKIQNALVDSKDADCFLTEHTSKNIKDAGELMHFYDMISPGITSDTRLTVNEKEIHLIIEAENITTSHVYDEKSHHGYIDRIVKGNTLDFTVIDELLEKASSESEKLKADCL